MTDYSLTRRLRFVERAFPDPRCPVCDGKPHRIVRIDPATELQVSESMPEDGCPECGALPQRTYVVVIERDAG